MSGINEDGKAVITNSNTTDKLNNAESIGSTFIQCLLNRFKTMSRRNLPGFAETTA